MPAILIVDDEPHIRLLLQETLEDFEDCGVDIYTASNGNEALKIINDFKPNIIFLDIMMPEMNGYDVCRTVKKKLNLSNIYIVLLTAKGQEYDKSAGFEAGADMYVTKPFDPDFIVSKAIEILRVKP
jgi:DNA-binding response OmpR family regulator